ncbi:Periplasmic serine endoprotease DegP [Planctomycetales bacterium 10988]|nr:Periplasmic serine endoprotease DegP [Planctomycetales bacterium 10988]
MTPPPGSATPQLPNVLARLMGIGFILMLIFGFLLALFMKGLHEVNDPDAWMPELNPEATLREVADRGDLRNDEIATIQVFREAAPSVVYIETGKIQLRFNVDPIEIPQGTGSGFVWSEDGLIITNYHVIENADTAKVYLADQSARSAKLVGAAPHKDLAVLKIDVNPDEPLRPIPVGVSAELQVGQTVLAIGNPFGLDHTLTTGVISGLDREIQSVTGRPIGGVIQTDAAINPGNSGGPLLDSAGRLIGINTAIKSNSGQYAGIGFAVPVDLVNNIVTELVREGRVRRPGLGVTIVDDRIVNQLRQTGQIQEEGVLIYSIGADSAAFKAGLKQTLSREELGDLIVAIDGQPIKNSIDLFRALDQHSVGETVEVTVIRNGKELTLEVTLQPLE